MPTREVEPVEILAEGQPIDAESVVSTASPPPAVRLWRLPRRPLRILAAAWLTLTVGLAVLAPVLPIPDYAEGGLGASRRPFGQYFLGTDQLGRDMFSRIVFGARTSLLIGLLSVVIAMIVGVALGLLAGYNRGKVDTVIVGIADVMLAFPGLVFLMFVAALAGPSVRNLVGALTIFLVPTFMRLARASTLSFAEREFVFAAKGLGARSTSVMVREILPNIIPPIRAYALSALGLVFVIEGSLSFLGLGIQPPTPSWGSMIAAGRPLLADAPHLVLVPSITLFLTVLAFNALSEGDARTMTRG